MTWGNYVEKPVTNPCSKKEYRKAESHNTPNKRSTCGVKKRKNRKAAAWVQKKKEKETKQNRANCPGKEKRSRDEERWGGRGKPK